MTTLLATHPAIAGLYGFDKANPYTAEEKILDMKYLPKQIRNYRADMRNNLQMLINYAKKNNPDFKIITHEGQEILYRSAWEDTRDGYNLARRQKGQQGSIEDTTFLSKGKEIPKNLKLTLPNTIICILSTLLPSTDYIAATEKSKTSLLTITLVLSALIIVPHRKKWIAP